MNHPPSILIVDDDAGIRRTLEMILTRKDYRVFTAPDGKTALALARENELNLALLDIRLPDLSGADLLAQLKTLQPDLEALIITGNATLESAIQALVNGAYHYFLKPLNPDELLITLDKALDQQRLVIENRALLASVQKELAERTRAEQSSRESEARLRQITSSMREAVWLRDTQTLQVLYVNPAYEDLWGRTCESLYQDPRSFLEAVHPEDKERVMEAIQKQYQGTLFNQEYRIIRPDGSVRWIWGRTFPIRDEAGQLVRVTAIAEDITERKRTENLNLMQRDLAMALNQVSDLDAGLRLCLDIALRVSGMDGGGIYLFDDATGALDLAHHRGLGATFIAQASHYPADSSNVPLVRLGAPVYAEADHPSLAREIVRAEGLKGLAIIPFDYEGLVIGCLNVGTHESNRILPSVRNVLETIAAQIGNAIARLKAEQARHAAEASYRMLFETVPNGVYRSSLAGKFLTVNPALVQMLGYASEEELLALDLSHDLYLHSEARQAWLTELLQKGELHNVEITVKRKDGQPLVALNNSRVIRDAQGNALFLEGTLTDITERKLRERELQVIAGVSAALRAASTREEMLSIILDQAQQFLNADALSINTHDPRTGETVNELARGVWASVTGRRIPPHQGIAAHVIETGRLYVTNDLQNDPLFYRKDLIGKLRGCVSVPLMVQDRAVGALTIGRVTTLTPEEVNVLSAIANIAASALQRAALHEKTEQRLQHLVALRTVDQTINASLDLRFTLDVLLDQVIAQLRVDAADILLYDPAIQTLSYSAARGFRTKEIERLALRIGESYAGLAARERRTLTIRNLAASSYAGRGSILAREGFVAYCGVPLIAKGQVTGVLEVFHRAAFHADPDWLNLLEMLAGQAALAIDNARLFEELQRSSANLVQSYDATIEGWSRALELRDRETEGHTQRVTELTQQLARAVGIGAAELVHIRRGALLHDIGKIAVPDYILLKNTALTEDEWVIMRRHPEFAYELLRAIPYLQPALDIPHYHHEKWDGSGYPRGLRGEAIPVPARLFALADVWDALRSDRPYRAAWEDAQAREYLRAQAGMQFDPNLVERFLKLAR